MFSIEVEVKSPFIKKFWFFCCWGDAAAICAFFFDVKANWIHDVVGVGIVKGCRSSWSFWF